MATSLAPDVKREDFAEPRAAEPMRSRAEWLWTLVGLVLLGAFLAVVVNDYTQRGLTAIQ